MALSNTATPIYFGQFRDAVLRGEIPVCEEIWLEMQRIEGLIANPNYWYDDRAVEGFIKFCENELTLTDGSDLKMLPSFKLWAEQVLGWYYFTERDVYVPGADGAEGTYVRRVIKKRLIKKQYLIVARGAAKSMYAEFFQAFFLVVVTATTHQVATSPTMKQSEEVLSPFRTAIVRSKGPLFKFLTDGTVRNTTGPAAMRQKLVSTKKGIENFLTNSLLEIRPMTIDKLQGLRCRIATVDEWLSGDIREDVIGALEQGASKGDTDYLIIAISSEGTVRNAAGDTVKMELAKILRGEFQADHYSIWHYKLDSVDEVADPGLWIKAQPNIGITVSYEAYQLDVERAESAPAARNDILAKRFGIPMEGFTYFFTYEETLAHPRQESYHGLPCAMGADLSQGDDFCAFTFMFPLSGPPELVDLGEGNVIWSQPFGIVTRSYITRLTLYQLPLAMRQKYDEFIEEGSLQVLEGTVLDVPGEVYDDLEAFIIANEYDVRAFGYDPYGAKEFVDRWQSFNGPYGIEKVIQGPKTESIPLGEMKKLAQLRLIRFHQSLMTFAMGNAVTLEDTNGNRKLFKKRAQDKIDNVSAWMDAYVAYKANKDSFD